MEDDAKSLREWRIDRLLTMDALAAQSGVSKQTINDAEKGRTVPRMVTIKRLSDALKVHPRQVREFRDALERMKGGD